jgi:hypothetical protein
MQQVSGPASSYRLERSQKPIETGFSGAAAHSNRQGHQKPAVIKSNVLQPATVNQHSPAGSSQVSSS